MSSLQQLIIDPNRTSKYLLDLLMVSKKQNKLSQSGVLDIASSDHNIQFTSTKHYPAYRLIQRFSKRYWTDVLGNNDVDLVWALFKQHFIAVLDFVAPIKETIKKQGSANWMSSECINSESH